MVRAEVSERALQAARAAVLAHLGGLGKRALRVRPAPPELFPQPDAAERRVPAQFFFTHLAQAGRAGRLHRGVPLFGPPRQRLPAELAHALHNRILGFIAGVEPAGTIFHLVEQSAHMLMQLRVALESRHQILGSFIRRGD